jgi:hypothetical protein
VDGFGLVVEDGGGVVGGEVVFGVAGWGRGYRIITQVLPIAPSPTITIFMFMASDIIYYRGWDGLILAVRANFTADQ